MSERTKRCSICGKVLNLSSFTRDRRAADGLDGRCRECKSGQYARWAARQDTEQLRTEWREYYWNNHAQRRVDARDRHQADPEPGRTRTRAWVAADIERARAAWRDSYHRRTPEMAATRRARQEAARLADPAAYNAMRRALYAANPEPAREWARRREAAKRAGVRVYGITETQIRAKVAYWGGRCWMCRTGAYEALDHVKPLAAGGPHMVANLRPACGCCNRAKRDLWPFVRVAALVATVRT